MLAAACELSSCIPMMKTESYEPLKVHIILDDYCGLHSYYLKVVTNFTKFVINGVPSDTQMAIRRFTAGPEFFENVKLDQVDGIMKQTKIWDPTCVDYQWDSVISHIESQLRSTSFVYVVVFTGCWINNYMRMKMEKVVSLINEYKRDNFFLTFVQADRGITRHPRSESPACWIIRNNCSKAHSKSINVGYTVKGMTNAFRWTKNHIFRWRNENVLKDLPAIVKNDEIDLMLKRICQLELNGDSMDPSISLKTEDQSSTLNIKCELELEPVAFAGPSSMIQKDAGTSLDKSKEPSAFDLPAISILDLPDFVVLEKEDDDKSQEDKTDQVESNTDWSCCVM